MSYKPSIILALLLFVISTHAKKQFDCTILNLAVSSKDFDKQFYVLDTSFHSNIVFIDTNRYFERCPILINGKPAEFSHELFYSPNKRAGIDSKGKIVILGITKSKGVYSIRFWAPFSNATLGLQIVKRKGKYKVITESRGSF